jgi:hypothetical protein
VSAAVVVARAGSRAAVLRRSEPTRFSSASDDKVGGFLGAIRGERQRAIKHRKNASARSSSVRRRAIADARSMRGDPDTETNERNAPFVLRERTTTSDSLARSAQAMHIALSAISGALLGEDTCGRVRWNEP